MGRVVVIDYGMGNLHSMAKALERVAPPRVRVRVSGDPAAVAAADRVVFPGVGAMRDCMAELARRGLVEAVREAAASRPFLGVCIGMQALYEESEENGGTRCLGILPGRVRFFGHGMREPDGRALKVPHMGWNRVWRTRPHPLWDGIADGAWFYFVHGYHAEAAGAALAATSDYGVRFAAAAARGNLFATQFHPEKSSATGLRLLANFLAWDGEG
ncbi:imidazole glycerol phosphate synthase subunit HisH [Inmirania thermothiophila]|uniref:Imidazole glycerol phosphate synthase subunit HisH n=1 Tax=Inmirania thermothiophila TaxID=1750597 RepID=A0A3N1Y6R1_9GAMM|nr:imidazole glycerol phosphate synthase subunit HisH [Inmirania thermothiophila]ROR34465.1 glutamine amidotransferase [Inmirania thermothiophila]